MKVLVQKIIRKKMMTVSLLLLVAIAGSAFFQQKEWKAPASADAKKNPLTADATTLAAGKAVYVKECQSCHGKKGKGDGPSAKDLDIPAGDFTKAITQSQSDGALYWKISEGRKPMPSFKKKLNETQIWQSVVYMRTLKQ
ncbi:MAG: c-type cytochrome [Sediminibacterium magnilacihabitans]|jgi:mono/diheme cytochrome c family protein|nr:c-type cytochrome [Sediminibacterium magnilacihabitans]PQV61832.1 mono/diheme cytochrome c family protein [Sediminibacterium magnilacihabitans]